MVTGATSDEFEPMKAPSPIVVFASEFSSTFEVAEGYGWSFDNAKFDWPTFLETKDVEIARLSGIYGFETINP